MDFIKKTLNEKDRKLDKQSQTNVELTNELALVNKKNSEQTDMIIENGALIEKLKIENDKLTLDNQEQELTIRKFIDAVKKLLNKWLGNGRN